MSTDDDWADELTAAMLDVARGELSARMARTGQRDRKDAIAFLVNTTIQEVERSFHEAARERDFARAVLGSVPDGLFVVDARGPKWISSQPHRGPIGRLIDS